LTSFITPKSLYADFGSPGQNGTNIIRLDVGQSIGQIWGPVFDHVSVGNGDGATQNPGGVKAGAPVFKDLDGDGKIDANPANALISGDFTKLGSGIPTMEIGWQNRLTYKSWDFNVFFRAAFGHSIVNQFRAFYEPIDPGAINSYNRVTTSKAVPGLTSAQYSSLYVEKADFFRLDNMTIGYTFKMKSGSAVKNLRLYGSGQNLFIITGYTGIDPDPSLTDPEQTGFASVVSSGIDRRSNYFTARTFTFGLNIGF
jgi:iron complex outermembrane receptor protein